jgi:toxin-antitoxin system PIN domain toxin
VIAVDTNILIYAHRLDSPFNAIAYEKVASLAEGRAPWSIPWPCVHEFLSIATHPRIYTPASTPAEALEQIETWIASPSLALLAETELHWPDLKTLTMNGRVAGPRVHDARIAALCVQHGVRELWSADRDFSRFRGVSVVNPLIGEG